MTTTANGLPTVSGYDDIVTAVGRETLAKLYFGNGFTHTEIAARLGVDSSTASRAIHALGLGVGYSGNTAAREYVLAHLPYDWVSLIREREGIEPAPRDEQYDYEPDPDGVPTPLDARDGAVADDVPAVYQALATKHAGPLQKRGIDVEAAATAASEYQYPDTVPANGLFVPGNDRAVVKPGTSGELVAGAALAVLADHQLESGGVGLLCPGIAASTASARLSELTVAGITEQHDTYPVSYTLTAAGRAFLRGETGYDNPDLSLSTTPQPDADSNGNADADADADADAWPPEPGELAALYYKDGETYSGIATYYGVDSVEIRDAMHDAGLNPGGRDATREYAVKQRVAELDTDATGKDVSRRVQRLRRARSYYRGRDDAMTEESTRDNQPTDRTTITDSDTMQTTQPNNTDTERTQSYTKHRPDVGYVPDGKAYVKLPSDAAKSDVEYDAQYWAWVNNVKNYGVFVSLDQDEDTDDGGYSTVSGLVARNRLLLYTPDEFEQGDEVVVELAGRKADGKLDFRLVRRLDGQPAEADVTTTTTDGDGDDDMTVVDAFVAAFDADAIQKYSYPQGFRSGGLFGRGTQSELVGGILAQLEPDTEFDHHDLADALDQLGVEISTDSLSARLSEYANTNALVRVGGDRSGTYRVTEVGVDVLRGARHPHDAGIPTKDLVADDGDADDQPTNASADDASTADSDSDSDSDPAAETDDGADDSDDDDDELSLSDIPWAIRDEYAAGEFPADALPRTARSGYNEKYRKLLSTVAELSERGIEPTIPVVADVADYSQSWTSERLRELFLADLLTRSRTRTPDAKRYVYAPVDPESVTETEPETEPDAAANDDADTATETDMETPDTTETTPEPETTTTTTTAAETEPDPAPQAETPALDGNGAVGLPEGVAGVNIATLRNIADDVAFELETAEDGSRMHLVARGKARLLRRLVESADGETDGILDPLTDR